MNDEGENDVRQMYVLPGWNFMPISPSLGEHLLTVRSR